MDTEPGYKHKIEAALDEAKEMSHKVDTIQTDT